MGITFTELAGRCYSVLLLYLKMDMTVKLAQSEKINVCHSRNLQAGIQKKVPYYVKNN
jgi:hypothetical protein